MNRNMTLIDEIYQKTIADNEKILKFWEDYLNCLKSLNFDVYCEKLRAPALVPIGNKIFFRGELKHTNEVTVSLGADYFVKCSIAQAEILRQHRIKDAQSKVDLYRKEKEHLESQTSFTKQNVYEKEGQEILEVYSEEEDKVWRGRHRENVRKYKQGKARDEIRPNKEITDEELWERLEELELQEELENEMLDNYNEIVDKRKENTFLVNEQNLLLDSFKEERCNNKFEEVIQHEQHNNNKVQAVLTTNDNKIEISKTDSIIEQSSKGDLLQKVLDKQNELENKLYELKYREREQSKTEHDLISRLDEMEQLDELEDEIERLDDILLTENMEAEDSNKSEDESTSSDSTKLKKSISFAEDDDTETLEINFTHSETVSNNNQYNPDTGITKPSDLYEAYANHFDNKTTSILKKSKYGPESLKDDKPSRKVNFENTVKTSESAELEKTPIDKTIVIKDVIETIGVNQHNIVGGARPTSIFKKKRMQNKS